jgi:hypothetical protein
LPRQFAKTLKDLVRSIDTQLQEQADRLHVSVDVAAVRVRWENVGLWSTGFIGVEHVQTSSLRLEYKLATNAPEGRSLL